MNVTAKGPINKNFYKNAESFARDHFAISPSRNTQVYSETSMPSAREVYKIAYDNYNNGNEENAMSIIGMYEKLRSDASSPYYNPYYKATNTQAIEGLRGLGVEIPKNGISQSWIDSLKPFADYSNTSVSGSLKAPAKGSTPGQDMAYWLYQLENDEITTQEAEAEWDEMQREIGLYVKMGYSDDDIIRKIDMSNYKTLSKMDESLFTRVPIQTTRGIGYSKDAMYGAIWAARNGGGTGNAEADFMNYAIGNGYAYTPDPKSEAALDATSEWYNPYGTSNVVTGYNAQDAAIEYRVQYFDRDWLNAHAYMLNGSEKEAKAYETIRGYVETSETAEEEYEKLNAWVDKQINEKGFDAEKILKMLQSADINTPTKTRFEANYPTLAKMEKARSGGKALDMGYAVDFAMPYFESDIKAKVSARDAEAAEAAQAEIEEAAQGNTPNKSIDNFTYTDFLNEQSNKPIFEADVSKTDLAKDIAAYWEGEKPVEELSPEAQGFVQTYGEFFGGMKTWVAAAGMKSQYDTRRYALSNMNIAEERADFMGEDAYNALIGIENAVSRGIMSGEEGAEQLFTLATVFDAAADEGIGVREYLEKTPDAQMAIQGINEALALKEQKDQEEKTNAQNILMQEYASCNLSMAIGAPLEEDQLELTMAIGSIQVDKNEESEKYNDIYENYVQPAIRNFYTSRGITDEETLKTTIASDPIMKAVSDRLLGVAFENDMRMAKHQGISLNEYYERTPNALDVYSEGVVAQMYGEYENAVQSFMAKERAMYSDRNRVRIAAGEAPLGGIDEAAVTQAAIEKTNEENDAQYQNEEVRKSLNDKGVFTAIGLGAKHGALGFAAGAADAFEWYVLRRSDEALEASLRGNYSRDEYRAYLEKTIPTLKDESEREALQKQLDSYDGDIYKFGFDPRTADVQNAVAELRNHQNEIEEYGRNHLSDSELAVLNVSSSVTYNTLAMLEAAALTYASGGGAGGMFAANLAAFGAPAGAESGKKFMQAGMDYDTAMGWSYIIANSAAGIEMLSDGIVSGIGNRVFGLPSQIRFAAHADAAAGQLARNYAPGFNASFASWARRAALNAGEFGVNLAYKGAAEGAEEAISSVIMQAEENAILNAETGSKNALVDWEQVLNESAMGALQGAIFGIGSTAAANRSTNQVVVQAGEKLAQKENQQKARLASIAEAFKNAKIGELVAFFATPVNNVEGSSALMQEINAMGNVQSLSTEQAQRILDAASKDIQNEVLVQAALDAIESGKADVSAEVIQIASETIGEFKKTNAAAFDAITTASNNHTEALNAFEEAKNLIEQYDEQQKAALRTLASEQIPSAETIANESIARQMYKEALENQTRAIHNAETTEKALHEARNNLDALMAEFIANARTEAQERVTTRAQEAADAMAKEMLAQAESVHAEVDSDIEAALSAVQERYGYSRKAIADMRQEIEGYSARAAEKLQTSREKLRSDLEKRLSGWKVAYAPLGETVGGSTNAAAREIVLNSDASLDEINRYVTAHELTHYAENSGQYEGFAKSVLEFVYGTNDTSDEMIQVAVQDVQGEYQTRTGQTLSEEAALREVVAKAVNERVFRGTESGKWVDRLVKGERNLALRIYDWIADQAQALYILIRNKDGEGRESAAAFRQMRALQKQFETVLDDAGVEYEKHTNVGRNAELLYSMLSPEKKAAPTEKDLEVIRNMPAQSINSLSDEEANALSAFANRSYQELEYDLEGNVTGNGIKSPFFRRIFGDWRAYEKTTVPVTVVNESKIDIGDIPRGSVINNDTGWNIAITRDAIDKTINENGKHSNVYKAMKDIDSVLSNAILVDTQTVGAPSAKLGADSALMHIFYAPIKAQNSDVNSLAKLYVSEKISGSPSSKKFYLIKAEKMSPSTGGDSNVEDPNTKMAAVTGDKYTVSEIYELVKRLDDAFQKKSEKKIRFAPVEVDPSLLNEDGTPKLEELKALASETAGEQLALLPDRRTQRKLETLALAADEAKEKGDTTAWKQIMDARQSLIETTGIRYEGNNPVRIAEKLAVALGGKVYTLKNEGSAYFDQHSKAIVEGKGAVSALSNTMQAIGEQIAEMPEIQDVSSGVDAAQFFFRYMTTGNKSLSAAEEAYRMQFEKALSEAGKLKDVQLARAQMLNYINSTAAEKVDAFITERYKPKNGIRAWLNQKLTENIDRTRPAQLVDSYAGGNALSVATAYLPYAKRMADRMFDEVMTDADGNVVYKGLGALFEETGLLDKDYKLLRDYLLSKHGLSRIAENKPIFPEGDVEVDLTEAQMREVVQMVENGMSGNPQYKRVYDSATALHGWWDAFMDTWVVGEGRLSKEDVMRMRKTYPYYVPTFREGYGIRLLGGELSDTGSKRRVYDPISSMQSMIAGVVNQVQQNRAARVFDEIYQRTPGLGWIAQETQPKVETIETTDDDGVRTFETKVTRPSDPGTLEVIRADGSRVYYNIADEGLYNLLSGSGAKAMKTGLEMVGRATRMMAKLTTELNLTFGAKNAIRDIQHSINYGSWASNYATGLLKWLPTFFEVARGRSQTLQGYKAMGGGEWERYATNTHPGTRKLRRALAKSTGISGALRRASSIPEIVLKLNEWSELTSRYVEYKYGKHDLTTPEGRREAFMAAQEATVDFQRGGDSTLARLMRQVVPFFNATVQGGYQQARMFTGAERERLAPRLAKTLINNALMGALSAGMVYALGTDEDKEKYANLSESAKNGYMIFPLFGDAEFMHMLGRPAGMDFIRLPLGQDALAREAYVFGNSLTDILMGDYESGISELASDLWGVTKDILANALPTSTILQPVFDVQANESFYGSPIVRESTRQNEHWTDWNDSTTPEIFKTASDFISRIAPNAEWAAPAYLEYMAGQWTGWMGQSVLSMLSKDYYTGEAGGMRAIAENFHKAFLFDSATTTDVRTEFDKRVTAIDRITGTTDAKTSELKPGLSEEEAKQAYIAANDLKDGILKYVEDQISEKYDEIRQVNEGEGTDFEKEARVAQLYDEIVALEKQAVSETEEFWKKYVYGGSMFASRAYIPEVSKAYLTDEIFRADYEDGAAYMVDAEAIAGLPGNENSTTIYPSPRHTMTAKDENGAQQEYALKSAKAEAEFDEMYREYYMEGYESLMDSYPGFWDDEYSDAERTTLWKKLHTHAQKMAQAEMWDNEAYVEVK